MIHFLKTWPQYFEQIRLKRKTFEIRKDDRGFMLGDQLCLEEWVPKEERPVQHPPRYDFMPPVQEGGSTGRFILTAPLEYIMRGPAFGLEAGHVILAIQVEATLEAGAGGPAMSRASVEEFIERARQIRAFKGTLNRKPGLVPNPNS